MALNLLFHSLPCSLASNSPRLLKPLSIHKASHPRRAQLRATLEECSPSVSERRTGNYHPAVWDHQFIESTKSSYSDPPFQFRLEELKREASRLLGATKELPAKLQLVDSMQRLGVAYHFDKEIRGILEHSRVEDADDLFDAALRFRLLRQHAYDVAPDAFEKFKDKEGNFKECLTQDVIGLLSLYEASYLGGDGEDILDEAKVFTVGHLNAMKGQLERDQRDEIEHALEMPLHWRVPRLEARDHINVYEKKDGRSPVLLELARLDFNVVQSIHQAELREMSRWWRDMDFMKNLTFTRDRFVESFMWGSGAGTFKPQFSKSRIAAGQVVALVNVIDDIYDVYGSIDELELFTKALERWDLKALDNLPDYMKIGYLGLFNFINEIAYDTLKDHRCNIISILQNEWQRLCKTYLVEAKWFSKGYTPTLEEYIKNGWISVGGPVTTTFAYIRMGQALGIEATDILEQGSKLIYWSSMLVRLNDDLGTSTAELERGDVQKCVQCHMHESGKSEEAAREHIKKLRDDAWKKLNKEALVTRLPRHFVDGALDISRVAQFFYHRGDGIGSPFGEIKDRLMSLFIEPV